MTPKDERIEALRAAVENFQGGTIFDAEAEEAKAAVRKRALGLLDQRARSRHELRGRLVDAEFDPQVIDEVLADLERAHLLDDAHFASEWVRQRHARRGKSAWALDRELKDKGVGESDRRAALEQVDSASEEETAFQVARKKARSEKHVPEDRAEYDKALRRVVGALARRGFSSEMSMRIGRKVLDERIADLEE
ncbi:recombination regulator RecX [Corynebacterium tapiri]